jgi:ribosomal protein S18 acetylase RimI-like enzyme
MAHIRIASPVDASAIDAAAYQAALQHYRLNPFLFALPDPESREWSAAVLVQSDSSLALVAEVEESVVGYVYAQLITEQRSLFVRREYGKVETVSVLPAYQGNGIGKALLAGAEAWLVGKGCEELRLNVWSFNQRAVRLYGALGYDAVSMFMAKRLVPPPG